MLLCKLMIITYFGKQFYKIEQGKLVIAFNPVSKNSKSGVNTHFGADIALISVNHPDYNGAEQLSYGDRKPFIINGPGDYEIKDIFIKGMLSEIILGGKKYINTIYSFELDGIHIVFLGLFSDIDLTKEIRETINGADILFVPVGGSDVLDPKNSTQFALSLEPKLIIPMDYDKPSLQTFLKETGEEKKEIVDKLTLKSKDLEEKEKEVVILSVT
jgi:hypothetical protein